MQALAHTQAFQTVPASHIHAASILNGPGALTTYSADEEIYGQGERAGTLYEVRYGAVRLYRLLSDGRRQVVAFHFAGETFGFEAEGVHSFFAEAIVETGLRKVVTHANSNINPEMLALALRGMVRAQQHLLVVGRQCATEKLGAFLLDLAERQGDPDRIDVPMTRLDIGDYLGMTIETVSRSISKLKAAGILKLHSLRSVEILRPEKLRQICE
ncbi:CRP/FNR family nitrogen fixation transcriptional regulator [Rhizobium aquaticum]|uniref:CRP/FNR family nitrogen fixation transcriptional regulator n=1 Tax=Rhizobium aquaticum TaxID=1549636 RepID=A0ABV2J2F4_9HYPH